MPISRKKRQASEDSPTSNQSARADPGIRFRPTRGVTVRFRFVAGLAVALSAVALGWLGWMWVGTWQVREGLAWARRRMEAKNYEAARNRLAQLSAWWPRQGEVEYLLGECEASLRRPEAALAAWGRVRAGSPAYAMATLARGRALLSLGRLTEAEMALATAAKGVGAAAQKRAGLAPALALGRPAR